MDALIIIAGLVATAFASTNLDNLALLIGWMLSGRYATGALLTGYLLGMLGVLALAVTVGLVGYLFPLRYLDYLGVIPIALGVRMLVSPEPVDAAPQKAVVGGSLVAVAATQVSNGVDTVLVFAPLLADSLVRFDAMIAASFLVMIFVWFGLARLLSNQAGKVKGMAALGRWVAPLVMIVVGFYILSDTATDMVPG